MKFEIKNIFVAYNNETDWAYYGLKLNDDTWVFYSAVTARWLPGIRVEHWTSFIKDIITYDTTEPGYENSSKRH